MGGGVTIAEILGNDEITQEHIGALLERNGVRWGMGGSKSYFVWVATDDAERAIKVLKEDRRAWPYQVWLADAPGSPHLTEYAWPADESVVVSRAVRLPVQEVFGLSGYAPTDPLGAALRQAIESDENTSGCPFLLEVLTRERPYCDRDGRPRTGYEVEFRFASTLAENAAQLDVFGQSWDDGKEFRYQGSYYRGPE